jgi:hypothetical protein
MDGAKAMPVWKAHVPADGSQARAEAVRTEPPIDVQVGGEILVQARVHLGAVSPDDVAVEPCL